MVEAFAVELIIRLARIAATHDSLFILVIPLVKQGLVMSNRIQRV